MQHLASQHKLSEYVRSNWSSIEIAEQGKMVSTGLFSRCIGGQYVWGRPKERGLVVLR